MKIALITIPRSGSTFYSREIAKKHNVKHAGELFHYKALTSKFGYDFPLTIKDSLRIWSHGNCVAKIFTRDFIHMPEANESLEFYEDLVYGSADKIYYLYRKNSLEHLKSIITADIKSKYSYYRQYKEWKLDVTMDLLEKEYEKIKLDVKRLDNVRNRFPGEIVYYEDFATPDKRYTYKSRFFCDGKELPENLGLDI